MAALLGTSCSRLVRRSTSSAASRRSVDGSGALGWKLMRFKKHRRSSCGDRWFGSARYIYVSAGRPPNPSRYLSGGHRGLRRSPKATARHISRTVATNIRAARTTPSSRAQRDHRDMDSAGKTSTRSWQPLHASISLHCRWFARLETAPKDVPSVG